MSEEIEIFTTHTGEIYVNKGKRLEFLTVGDYGKQNNIKADFLGFTKKIEGVENTNVDLSKKWVATISTQHGCPMNCRFCDCPYVGFTGNVSYDDLDYQIRTILQRYSARYPHTDRFNVHYARMGEPSFNNAVLDYTKTGLRQTVAEFISATAIHPVVSTMLPKHNPNLEKFVLEWCRIKNEDYEGEAGLQLSINSTDEAQRDWLFKGKSLSLKEISELSKKLPHHVGRKYTLNFPVTKETILDPTMLSSLFDKNEFIVKITPIHNTIEATKNGLETNEGYYSYDVYEDFEKPLLAEGWQVIVFVPSVEEDADRITCGNALLRKILNH